MIFWFHRLFSLSIKTEILLDVGDLHNVLQPSLLTGFPTLNTLVDLTACTSFGVTDYKHGQVHVSQSKDKQYGYCASKNPRFHIPLERLEQPSPAKLWTVQFSCSLYLYISLCGCWGVAVGGVALVYIIPSILFELDFYRILCRIFCFGWNTSSSKRFLFSVSRTFRPTSLAATNPWGACRVGKNFWRRNSLWTRKWWKTRHFLLCCSAHFCLGNIAPCWICCDCRTLVF